MAKTKGLGRGLDALFADAAPITEEERVIFNLPIEESLRTLIKYQKNSITNLKYPRRYSEIIKKDI